MSNGGRAAYSCGIAPPQPAPTPLELDPQADAASLARMAFHLECGIQRACPDSHVSQPVSGTLRGGFGLLTFNYDVTPDGQRLAHTVAGLLLAA